MFGLDYMPSDLECCERCQQQYIKGQSKHFAAFTECLFYQGYSTIYGCEVCYQCLIFINSRLGEQKLDIATMTGLTGFLTTFDKRSAAVHVTLIINADGQYRPQYWN
jgi:hypothetical protein